MNDSANKNPVVGTKLEHLLLNSDSDSGKFVKDKYICSSTIDSSPAQNTWFDTQVKNQAVFNCEEAIIRLSFISF